VGGLDFKHVKRGPWRVVEVGFVGHMGTNACRRLVGWAGRKEFQGEGGLQKEHRRVKQANIKLQQRWKFVHKNGKYRASQR